VDHKITCETIEFTADVGFYAVCEYTKLPITKIIKLLLGRQTVVGGLRFFRQLHPELAERNSTKTS